jgi:uncharacterized protein
MLTGKLVRVRSSKNRLIPAYIDIADGKWRETAEHLLEVFRELRGKSRAEIEEEIREVIDDNPTQLVHQGLAKLLEDRCEFEVNSDFAPDELREKVFLAAAAARRNGSIFERGVLLDQVAGEIGTTPELLDQGLFADLKSEQRCVSFDDFTAEQLLHRYNVAIAQAILLRSTGVTVQVFGETAARYRQLFRAIKFHRLICDIQPSGPEAYTLRLDGPLSLFSATQKYGVQLANFLPTLIQCKRFELNATVRWYAERKEMTFTMSNADGLKSHRVDFGDYMPKELQLFADSFAKNVVDWKLAPEADIVSLPSGNWVPDFQLVHVATGVVVRLDVLGFWRRTDVDRLYKRLAAELNGPFILAMSEQFNIDETASQESGAHIYRFKKTPLPAEIVKLAAAQVGSVNPKINRRRTSG